MNKCRNDLSGFFVPMEEKNVANRVQKFLSSRPISTWLPFAGFILFLMALMVWDMSSVRKISLGMHNNHEDLWTLMNGNQTAEWFSNSGQCTILRHIGDSVNGFKSAILRTETCR